jgi:putative intracellular protease/amidase
VLTLLLQNAIAQHREPLVFNRILAVSILLFETTCASQRSQPREMTMSKKVLIVLTSHATKGSTGEPTGAYLAELTHPYEVFHQAGFAVDFASVKGGQVPLDGVDRKDPTNATFLDDAPLMARLHQSMAPADIQEGQYDAIFYAGGHGTMWDFPQNERLAAMAASIYERGGIVSAVCHGPAALLNIKLSTGKYLIAGKDVAAFTNAEEHAVGLEKVVPFLLQDALTERGATVKPAANWAKQVVVSERVVTGQNPASARGVAEAVVAHLQQQ